MTLPEQRLAIIILAAGKGIRMKNPETAKVMYQLDGRPMVEHVSQLAFILHPQRVLIVVGHQKQLVADHISTLFPSAEFVHQLEQLGTGHAVMQTDGALRAFDGSVLVLSGDVPLLTQRTLESLLRTHREIRAVATVLTAELANPEGYGRVVRNADGALKKIVEEKDADPETRQIREINSGVYVFKKTELFEALRFITPENAQHEYYLTDVFEHFWNRGWKVAALKAERPEETSGVNSAEELDYVRKLYHPRS
ncbi:MAG: sugar phosphate nucleotidyltransferase [Bacteroidota bacterium]